MLSLLVRKSLSKSPSRVLSLSRTITIPTRPILSTNRPAHDSPPSMDDLLFRHPAEFPAGWENGQHPDDYKPLSAPLKPQFICGNSSLWYRVSFKIQDEYLPMSFWVNTGAPSWIYLGGPARRLLQPRRIGFDHRMTIGARSFEVVDNDEPVNIIGVGLVEEFGGMRFIGYSPNWCWVNPPEYF
ncbi:hypothetical protein K438DRAFT_1804522 [Mycena galopus ATCC 62051]|nr:hypothetical protein K438DRAFT_1804522 [Mycena galopus ATCC 62051]